MKTTIIKEEKRKKCIENKTIGTRSRTLALEVHRLHMLIFYAS